MAAPAPKSTCEFFADDAGNVLRIWYRGRVTAAAMQAMVSELPEALKKLRPGFTTLVDLGGLETMEVECVDSLTRLMETCKQAGVAMVIRIIPDREKDIGLNILSLTHYRRGVRIVTCESPAEAERTLHAGRR